MFSLRASKNRINLISELTLDEKFRFKLITDEFGSGGISGELKSVFEVCDPCNNLPFSSN